MGGARVSSYHEAIWHGVPENAPLPFEHERRQLVTSSVRPGDAVLDLGCGDGRFSRVARAAGGEVTAVDVSQEALRRTRAACPDCVVRLVTVGEPLPFDAGRFDFVIAMEVANQVVDVALFLSEARRVLRENGRMVVTVPSFTRLRAAWMALRGFDRSFSVREPEIRFFTKRSLTETMADAGFRVDRLEEIGGLPGFRGRIFCIASTEHVVPA